MTERKRRRAATEKKTALVTKTVTTTVNKMDETEEVTKEVEVFETDPAYVMVKAGVTRSLAQYESLRVDVSVSMPCYKEMVQQTYDATAEMVADMLENEVDQYLGSCPYL
jgi:hypothetical protein